MKQVRIFSTILILTFLILAACGGGGGGGSSSSSGNTGSSNASNNTGSSNSGGTGTISLAWDAAPSQGVAGYKVHYGTSSGNLSMVVDAGNTTTCTVSNLQSGVTYYLAVSDYDAGGDESGYSNEISGTAR